MFWMFYPIDVIFIDSQGSVVGLDQGLKPWTISRFYGNAQSTIEVPSNTVAETKTELGDLISIEAS